MPKLYSKLNMSLPSYDNFSDSYKNYSELTMI